MLYGPFAAVDAPRVGVAPAAGVATLANRLTPSDAAKTPAPMVFRASLRPMLISDFFESAIVNLHPVRPLQPKLRSDAAVVFSGSDCDAQKISVTVPNTVLGLLSRLWLAIVGTQRSENDSGAFPASLVS